MGKTRVGVILRESVNKGKSTNESADLKALTDKYQAFVVKLRGLLKELQEHGRTLQQLESSRTKMSQSFSAMAKGTPLWEATGQMPGGDRPSDSVCSYASVHDAVSAKNKSYVEKYQQFVISYVQEWEKTVTNRVDSGLKKAEEQRRELDHYQKKVESLRLSTNKAMAQGKSIKSDTQEKLRRNEEKLVSAKQSYNKTTSALCLLMDEVAERSWRDLHPLLIKCSQFDMTMAQDESRIFSSFTQVVNKLKEVGSSNGISPQHRLKDLANLNPEMLTTRPGGAAGLTIEAASSLSPTNSLSPTGSGGGLFDSMALPPGSVGPQGMGGFPIQVASSAIDNDRNVSRASSFSSYASGGALPAAPSSFDNMQPPSTLNMLSISQSAAPPPTMEDVYSSSYTVGGSRSAPSTGNLPPLPPSTTPTFAATGARSNSFGDMDAYGGGGPVAPPPMAAPPPPPPPAGGGYGYGVPAPAPASYGGPWGAPPAASHTSPYATTTPPATGTNPFSF